MRPGEILQLDVEKAAAGGRMLARHQGRVVLVSGAIPGERVSARIERVTGAVAFAKALEVTSASPDRRADAMDLRCGGCAFAHIAYERQLQIKQQIVQDAFGRIGRAPLSVAPAIARSPEREYRMRARLHAKHGRLGFFREGSHDICDAESTGQLAASTVQWIARASETLRSHRLEGLTGLEIAETIDGRERVCHLELEQGVNPQLFRVLFEDVVGISSQQGDRADVAVLAGSPSITEVLTIADDDGRSRLAPEGSPEEGPSRPSTQGPTLQRHVRAFFQSNRFLVETLARDVSAIVPAGPVVDLYAGVGLFGLSLAARGSKGVTLVEGDAVSGADLEVNARPYEGVRVERQSVERFVDGPRFTSMAAEATVIVDPPRTGLSKPVLAALVSSAPPRVVYVSCDPATLARDCRGLLDGGYEIEDIRLFDMFPNTAHIESVVSFVKTKN